ncbi:hypothetical protein KAR91_34950, partial [Candidatus Pacearchaeota archaeon]|nr:hypothetical protein [Candidatus Pacearchaeota archaeon]
YGTGYLLTMTGRLEWMMFCLDGIEDEWGSLTNINYSDVMRHNLKNGALSTVSMYTKDVPISLGLLE